MTAFTDGEDAGLIGSFNWTFSLGADLAVPEHAFPMDTDLGIWSWHYDTTQEKGIVRMYVPAPRNTSIYI
jgi:deoxyribodipyrimidine photolyase|eukprot:COSAG06_NODE_27155_length_599_cov_1.134000_1_plen_70_part_00